MLDKITYMPITPGGTILMHLESDTEEGAWDKLLEDASHMPYRTKANFIKRGYEIGTIRDPGDDQE